MNGTWPGFTFLNEGVLMQKTFFITLSICFALYFGNASPIQAQTTYPVNGTAGFDTGLQRVANLTFNPLFPPGIDWGDGMADSFDAVLVCPGTVALSALFACDAYGTHRYASAGPYSITIVYGDPLIPFQVDKIHTTATISPVGDFVILSIGDSIASGEGDPVVPSSAINSPSFGFWDDPYSNDSQSHVADFAPDEMTEWPDQAFPCHLSSLAGPAQAARAVQVNNPGVTFIHYACSGAKINPRDTQKNTVQDAVGQLRVARGRLPHIDVLIISAGANSLSDGSDCVHKHTFGCGFGALFTYCMIQPLVFNACSANQDLKNDVANSLNALPAEYARLAKEINCVNPYDGTQEPSCTDPQNQIPKLVLITEYMDPTHDQNGNYPVLDPNAIPPRIDCPAFPLTSQDDWQYFHSVVDQLNQQVDKFSDAALAVGLSVPTFAVTGIEQDFLDHGLCAGGQRWVLTTGDSTSDLGTSEPDPTNSLGGGLNGSGHPNSIGQADFRDRIYAAIVADNVPVTTASATVGGSPYPFGMWTNQDVTVTLSATNAIKESGVKQTLYAVDDTADCQPVTWPRCSVYGGPFAIGESGKHTVTFDSQNNAGFMWSFQNVQVWIDKNPPVNAVPGTLNVRQGQSTVYLVTVGHVGWDNQTVNLSCQTDAELGTCSMVPASVSLDGANSPTASAIVVTTRGSMVPTPGSPAQPPQFGPLVALRILLALGTAMFLLATARAMRRSRWAHVGNFAALTALFAMLCAGCGGAGIPGTPHGTYTVTITGTSGMTTNTVQTKLVVQ